MGTVSYTWSRIDLFIYLSIDLSICMPNDLLPPQTHGHARVPTWSTTQSCCPVMNPRLSLWPYRTPSSPSSHLHLFTSSPDTPTSLLRAVSSSPQSRGWMLTGRGDTRCTLTSTGQVGRWLSCPVVSSSVHPFSKQRPSACTIHLHAPNTVKT